MSPNKLLIRVLLVLAYLWLSIRILFVEVPPMLRAADSGLNTIAGLVVVLWVVFTFWIAYSWWFKKNQSKSLKDKTK